MSVGILFCFLGALSFGLLGSVAKAAERRKCNAFALVVSLLAWATLFMLIRTIGQGAGFNIPGKGIVVAVVCGICASVAALAFQVSMQMGEVTIPWLMMNLSTGVPAVVSIYAYHERLTPMKILALVLAVAAVLLLAWGQRVEQGNAEGKGADNVALTDARHSAD